MPTTIKLKNSVTTTSVPSSLVQGEVAINITDKKVWVGNAATTPIQLLGGGADGNFTNISVSSVATFGAGTVSAPSITTTGDTNTGMFFPAADTIAFAEGGVESMRIDSSGNVGIGTSSPSGKFNVGGGRSNFGANSETFSIGLAYTQARVNSGQTYYIGASDSATPDLILSNSAGTERMRITNAGDVGIGTSSPTQKLDVVASNSQIHFGTATTGGGYLMSTVNGQFRISGGAVFDGSNWIAKDTTAGIIGVDGDANIKFFTNTSLTSGNSFTPTERMRIDSSGNLGLGTTATTTYRATIANNGGNQLRLYATDVSTTTTNTIDFWYLDSGGSPYNNTSIRSLSTANAGNGNLAFYTTPTSGSLTERMRITSGGDLFIGTTSASFGERLSIKSAGTSSASDGIYISNSAGTTLFRVRSDGAFQTGAAAVSPYNNTTGSAANTFVNTDGTLLRSTSSLKYKKDVTDATHGLTDLLKLRSVIYKSKNIADGEKTFGGLIAEEVHEAGLTEFVHYSTDGSPDALNYGNMVSLLAKAIQELNAKVEAQAAEIALLKSK